MKDRGVVQTLRLRFSFSVPSRRQPVGTLAVGMAPKKNSTRARVHIKAIGAAVASSTEGAAIGDYELARRERLKKNLDKLLQLYRP